MATIQITGKNIVYPRLCPCCVQPTNELAEIKKTSMLYLVVVIMTRSMRLVVPYCAQCQRHARWHAGWGTTGVVLKSLLAWVVGAVLTGIYLEWGNALGAVGGGLGAAAVTAWYFARGRPDQPLSSALHARQSWAFVIRSFGDQGVTLALHSEAYAQQFLNMNAPAAKRMP